MENISIVDTGKGMKNRMKILRTDEIPHFTEGYISINGTPLYAGMRMNKLHIWYSHAPEIEDVAVFNLAYVETNEDFPAGASYLFTTVGEDSYVYHVVKLNITN